MSTTGVNNPFTTGQHDDLVCDQCGRQLCDGACQVVDEPSPPQPQQLLRAQSYQPRPFRSSPLLTESSDDDGDRLTIWKPEVTDSAPDPKELPFQMRYIDKPRLSSKVAADPAFTFFRTQPSSHSSASDLDLEDGRFPIPDAVMPPPRRQRQRRRLIKSESDTTETMRTAAAHWSADRDPDAIWYIDPLATQRARFALRPNANGALRSSACRAVQCFLVMSAALSVIILIAIGATMILSQSFR